MEKNILAQEKLSAKVFSSPINRYPLFSTPTKREVHTTPHRPATVERQGSGKDLTYLVLSRDRRQERLGVKAEVLVLLFQMLTAVERKRGLQCRYWSLQPDKCRATGNML